VEMMAAARGQTIQPLLASHAQHLPPGYLSDKTHLVWLATWTPEEDELVKSLRASES
jgi:hypothetical protein